MNICTSANSKYVKYLYVMLYSLLSNNDAVTVYILQKDFNANDKQLIKGLFNGEDRVIFIDIDDCLIKNAPTTEKISVESYYRLYIPEVIPENIDRILYLDVDIIVNGSLECLFEIDMGEASLGVCRDRFWRMADREQKDLFGWKDECRYFNAGVILWNLRKLRGRHTIKKCVSVMRELDYNLKFHDNDLLNYMYHDNLMWLPSIKYNYQSDAEFIGEDFSDETVIFHFAGSSPWSAGLHALSHKIWWEYAKNTPFYMEIKDEMLDKFEAGYNVLWEELHQIRMYSATIDTMNLLSKNGLLNIPYESKMIIYGHGELGKCFYKHLSQKDKSRVIGWIDKKIRRNFVDDIDDIPICSDLSVMDLGQDNYIMIVTPSYQMTKLTNEIRKQVPSNVVVVSLMELLEKIAGYSIYR